MRIFLAKKKRRMRFINKRLLPRMASLVLIALLLFGCASAPPETRAGEWKASADFGEFTFVVDPSGTAITKIEYSFQSCSAAIISGSATFSGTLARQDGSPIASIENGRFTLDVTGIPEMSFQGKFNRTGTRASGSWTAGACSGKWVATR